jgi:hypothetical protein
VKTSKSVSLDAHALVHGVRRKEYGPVRDSFQWVADLANVVLPGKDLSPEDIALLMICVKLARERHSHKRDNLVDLCGYADLLQQLHEGE